MTPIVLVARRAAVAAAFAILLATTAHAADGPKASSSAPPPSAEEILKRLKPGHPRLLLDRVALDDLKRRLAADAQLQEMDRALRAKADGLLRAPLPKHGTTDGLRMLSTSRHVLDRTLCLALAYRLHGDRRHIERLGREMETVAAFPDFNPRHFLDTAEMTHALAIAYDWLYDDWTPAQRSAIREAIVAKGLLPGLKVYRKHEWWARCSHNWNQVCNGGLIMGALAVADESPAEAGEVLHAALASLPLALRNYGPDGGWNEGPGYWSYATQYTVVALAGLQSALGTDFGLAETPGFAQTGLFPIYMVGPGGRGFNFADCGENFGRAESLLWLAERFHLPVCAHFGARRNALAMLWYRGPGQDPAAAGLPLDKYFRQVEAATMRSAWNDPRATFVGLKAGSNQANHSHLDLGSFVLDALGQRWAVDLGADDYNLPGYFGRERFDYYRLRAEGHNTLVLDPDARPDQVPKASAEITRFESRPQRAFAIADLTPAYAAKARRIERGVALLDRRAVLVEDEVETKQPAAVWWFMHTRAAVRLGDDGRTATLQQGGASLEARILAPPEARFEVRPARPLPTSPDPRGQKANDDTRKLSIRLERVEKTRIAVLLTPLEAAHDAPPAPTVRPLAQW